MIQMKQDSFSRGKYGEITNTEESIKAGEMWEQLVRHKTCEACEGRAGSADCRVSTGSQDTGNWGSGWVGVCLCGTEAAAKGSRVLSAQFRSRRR